MNAEATPANDIPVLSATLATPIANSRFVLSDLKRTQQMMQTTLQLP